MFNSIILLGLASDYITENKVPRSRCTSASDKNSPSPSKEHASPPGAHDLKRSKSVGSDLNMPDEPPLNVPEFHHRQSFSNTPRPLFSNSTVSLNCMSLNEQLIAEESEAVPSVVEPKAEEKPARPPPKPLHEVDRYTMCSNRII